MQGMRLGSYEILSELGTGGMGTVYLAKAVEGATGVLPGMEVALKVIHPHLVGRSQYVERFKREGRVGQRVRHENVVTTYAIETASMNEHEALFLVMERVVGRTLRSLLQELERIPEGLLREVAHQVAAGLAAIHAEGIVHRDLKPENVLVSRSHAVRIMDLGVAHVIDETVALTEAGDFAGSLLYAAPEQFGTDPVGPAADLYALGVVLYELASGHHPFKHDDAGQVIRAHLEQMPTPLREIVPDVSPFFSALVQKLLAKAPADRFESSSFLRDVLEHAEGASWWREQRAGRKTPRPARPRVRVPRETALHGRAADIADLESLWAEAQAGRGCTVFLEGEAGIGKTRLVDAFVDRVSGEDVHVLYGSYAPGGGVGGLSESIVEHFGEGDLTEALRPYIAQAPALAPGFAAILQHVTPPHSAAPVSGDALQALTVYLMRGLAAEKPLLWIVDDLQFAGPDSRKVALGLARGVEGHRVMLLVTARPGLPETDLASYDRLTTVHRRVLRRLSPREVIELLRDALRSNAVADRLGGTVAYKSDGVPLFVLEMVRALKADRLLEERPDGSFVTTQVIEDIQVPSAVRGLVEARLSSLTPPGRLILEVGAVQGYEFDAGLVAHVLEMKRIPVLQTLADIERNSGIVRATGRHMRFDHHQIQEVLYAALPEALRVEYHAALAESFVEMRQAQFSDPAEVVGEDAVFLASHHLRGSRPEKGLPFLRHALDHLESSYRNEALVDLVGAALAEPGLLTADVRVELLIRRAERLGYLGRGDLERSSLEEAEGLAQMDASKHQLAVVKTRLGWCHVRSARYDEAELALAAACFLAQEADDAAVESEATETLGVATFYRSRYEEAQGHFERARALARRAGDLSAEAKAVGGMGVVLRAQGRHVEAQACHEQHLAMAREAGDRRGVMNALGNLANLLNYQRSYAASQAKYEEALAVASEIGDRAGQAALHGSLAVLLWEQGRIAEAHPKFETTLMLDREIGNRDGEARMLLHLAEVWRVLGAADEARRDYDAALALCRQIGSRLLEGHALLGLASVQRELARYAEASDLCEQAVDLFRELGLTDDLADALGSLGAVLDEAGRPEEARETLAEALGVKDARTGTADVALRRCRLAAVGGLGTEDAIAAYEAARPTAGFLQRMSMLHLLWRASGEVRCLDQAWTLLSKLRADAPAPWRAAMVECVRMHRDIKADYERAHANV